MTLRRLALVAAVAYVLGVAAVVLADDVKIFADWNEVKKKGKDAIKARAEFWTAKGVTGKDVFWLARMWDESGEDDKAVEIYAKAWDMPDVPDKNKEVAIWNTVKIHAKKREWAKVIEGCERLRKAFPDSAVKHESFDEQGRAHRMLGEDDKAVAAFTQSADLGFNAGVIDLVDHLLAAGKVDEAKTTVQKYIASAQPGKEKSLLPMQAMLETIGSAAPSLEGAVSVGTEEAPTAFTGKPTFVFFWHMTLPTADRDLQFAKQFQKSFGSDANVVAVSKYDHYNPTTRKVEPDMAPEEEQRLFRAYLTQAPGGAPTTALLLPADVADGLHLRTSGQKTVVDAEGKIRYARLTDASLYDWLCVEVVVKRLLGK